MPEFGLKKNGEGYNDPTPYEAINGAAKPGEIWAYGNYEVLILQNHKRFCSVLKLTSVDNDPANIEICGKSIQYTHPGMIQYVFTDTLEEFVKTIPEADFKEIMATVHESLGYMPEPETDSDDACRIAQIVELRAFADKLAATNEKLYDTKAAAEAEAMAATIKADIYEKLYNDLLCKFIAKGAAEGWQVTSNG